MQKPAIYIFAMMAWTLAFSAASAEQNTLTVSVYEHGAPEANEAAPVIVPHNSPLIQQPYYRGARELFAYNPRFFPSEVAFDPNNRPYMRSSNPHLDTGNGITDGFIQTLNDSGQWVTWSIVEEIQRTYPAWDGTYVAGIEITDTRIVTDKAGDVYTLVRMASSPDYTVLLHLPQGSQTWQTYNIPTTAAYMRLEETDTYSSQPSPPLIIGERGNNLRLYNLTKNPDGTLNIPEPPITFSPTDVEMNPFHSGGGRATATLGDKTYMVFMRMVPEKDESEVNIPGSPQYIMTYDHTTSQASDPVLLGFGQSPYHTEPDNHNGPAIVADSQGYLHVVMGAHQEQFWYTRSTTTTPTTADDWTTPEALGYQRRYDCGLTYISLVIDANDTLHLVARNMSRGTDNDGNPMPHSYMNMDQMRRTLDYFRATKQGGGTWLWEELNELVVSFHPRYSNFTQKMTIDKTGRLFVLYYTYVNQLPLETAAAYREKWPDENLPFLPDGSTYSDAKRHDPVVITSDDGGDTWRIALTKDFTGPQYQADFDDSGTVDVNDLAAMAAQWLHKRTPYIESGGLVVAEAEHFHTKTPGTGSAAGAIWADSDGNNVAGDGYMVSVPAHNGLIIDDPNIHTDSPRLTYNVQFSTAGTYYFWLKALATDPNDDSIHYGLNAVPVSTDLSTAAQLPTTGDFTWHSLRNDAQRPTVTIPSTGPHTLDLWMREDGAKIDRLLLTTDINYSPASPTQSPCGSAPTTDLTDDTTVNLKDLAIFAADWMAIIP